ncbi:hypothetical protein [Pseudonocardia sp.]|uniref:hypothetical protein n=1 Tax=Pseudonocardia sp. TaxID=60912 RepID=UPI0031FE30B4
MRLGDEDDLRKGPDSEDRDPKDSDNHDRDAQDRDSEHLPIDVAALRADDALVEELAAGLVALGELHHGARGSDDELVAMLAAWVADVRPDAQPTITASARDTSPDEKALGAPSLVSLVRPASAHGRHRAAQSASEHGAIPYARRLAVAAAVIMMGTAGLAVGSSDASPGEALWSVSKVFYAERARSVEAAAEVNTGFETARTALQQGRPADAARAIAKASALLDEVRPAEGRAELAHEHQLLLAALSGEPSGQSAAQAPVAPAPRPPDQPGTSSTPASTPTPSGSPVLASPPLPAESSTAPRAVAPPTGSGASAVPSVSGVPDNDTAGPSRSGSASTTVSVEDGTSPSTAPATPLPGSAPQPPTGPTSPTQPESQPQVDPSPQSPVQAGPEPQPEPQPQPQSAPEPQTGSGPLSQPQSAPAAPGDTEGPGQPTGSGSANENGGSGGAGVANSATDGPEGNPGQGEPSQPSDSGGNSDNSTNSNNSGNSHNSGGRNNSESDGGGNSADGGNSDGGRNSDNGRGSLLSPATDLISSSLRSLRQS